MKFTLIGGAGSVGGWLTENLRRRGHQVLVADAAVTDESPDQTRIDALSPADVARVVEGADLVVHLAAIVPQADEPPARTGLAYAVNVGSVVECLRACRDAVVPMVHISSMSVFEQYLRVPVDPRGRGDNTDTYGFSKRLAEFACHEFAGQFDMRVTSLRLAFPTSDEAWPLWERPRGLGRTERFMDDGTPVPALAASQLADVVEECLQMPFGHRALAVTGAPVTLIEG
ncbi:NAD-dependent epimerase/dehydratase family protein [Propionibacteriaceae bacterium G1746]|uniref:NAD-dependent epimerase/dehydratase family protein n=1 Tax=Aestuariimicrobium sp. G57 TaxID=3418485 RepID=UPI003C287484